MSTAVDHSKRYNSLSTLTARVVSNRIFSGFIFLIFMLLHMYGNIAKVVYLIIYYIVFRKN